MHLPLLGKIAVATYLLPVAIGIIRFKKLNFPARLLVVMCVLSMTEVGVSGFVAIELHLRNYFVSQYYRVLEVSFVCAIYYAATPVIKRTFIMPAIAILFVMIWSVKMMFFYNPAELGGGISIIARLFMIAASLIALQSLLVDSSIRLIDMPVFWMVSAVILNAAGSLVVLGLVDTLLKISILSWYVAYHINWSLEIAANLLFSKALLCRF